MWHSIKYTCQSKDISRDIFVSYTDLCPRRIPFIIAVYCVFSHPVYPLDWLCSKKQRHQEENLQVLLSHIYLKELTFVSFFWSPKFLPNTWKQWGLSASHFRVSTHSFPHHFAFYLQALLVGSAGRPETGRLRHCQLGITRKIYSPIASEVTLCQPFRGFQSLPPCKSFQPIVFKETSKENILRLLFTVSSLEMRGD